MSESANEPGLISDDQLPEDLQPDESSDTFDEERGEDPSDPLTDQGNTPI